MQRIRHGLVTCGLLVAGPSVVSAADADAANNPLATTIDLLSGLAAKVTTDGEAEEKAFKEYFEYCDDMSKQLQFEIKTSTSQKEGLEAKISQLTSVVEVCDTKIEELGTAISSDTEDLKKATALREEEEKTFKLNEKELVSSIDTLGRAQNVLQEDASLAQISSGASAQRMGKLVDTMTVLVDAAGFSVSDKETLMSLVQANEDSENEDDADDEEAGAPAASAYKKKSGSIVEVLQDLQEKAETQLEELRKQEVTSKQNYDMLKQSLDAQLAQASSEMDKAKGTKAEASEEKAESEGELSVTVKALGDSKDKLKEGQRECMQVAADHQATVTARSEELKQIAQAQKILIETTGGAEGQTYSFLQASSSTKREGSKTLFKLKQLAKQERSAALAQLAMKVKALEHYAGAAGLAGVFDKVKSMLGDMKAKLEAEAQEEAEEKGFCDKELAKTNAKKDDLDAETEKLTSRRDVAVAKSTELKAEVKGVQKELLSLAQSQGEADKIRQEEHADYVQTKADLEKGLAGVQRALGVLRDYYAKEDDDDAALIQDGAHADDGFDSFMQQPKKPQKFSKSGGSGGSIIGILEIVESDFAKTLSTEEDEEADNLENYEAMTQQNKVSKAKKEQDVKYKTKEYKSLDKSIAELGSDLGTIGDEMDAVLKYLSELKERCIAKPDTYEMRKKRRDKEVAGLKDALGTLESETFLQRTKKEAAPRASFAKKKKKALVQKHKHMRGSTAQEMADAVGA